MSAMLTKSHREKKARIVHARILDFARVSLKSAIDSVLLRGEIPRNKRLRETVAIDRKTYRDAGRLIKLLEGAIR